MITAVIIVAAVTCITLRVPQGQGRWIALFAEHGGQRSADLPTNCQDTETLQKHCKQHS